MLESCAKQAEYRSIVFALCYFHAALLERKKFGVGNIPGSTSGIGWNMNYPFNAGDLICCGQLSNNYLENNVKVPWDDLRYMFGEIMYGGHIVEDWDRRLANAYLVKYVNEALLETVEFFPGFNAPGELREGGEGERRGHSIDLTCTGSPLSPACVPPHQSTTLAASRTSPRLEIP